MLNVGIIGGTGYAGGELARILCTHPGVSIAAMTSRGNAGRRVDDVHPFLHGYTDLEFTKDVYGADPDVVFVATPHGVAMQEVPGLLESGVKVIDLSGDYRLHDADEYRRWYGHEHTDLLNLERSVYGLPEFFREEIREADLVANPGCYATAVELACGPLLRSGKVGGKVMADAKSGTSGAGMVPTEMTHHPVCGESVIPYGIGKHRHTPEIEESLEKYSGQRTEVTMVPHLVPIVRGILATCYLGMSEDIGQEEADGIFTEQYGQERFVHHSDDVSLRSTVGSNHARTSVTVVGDTAVAFCAVDNLVKGASGQAVQCMNLMMGLDEGMGLDFPGLGV